MVIIDPHSISAGLDYPGVGPEHALRTWSEQSTTPSGTTRSRRSTISRLEGIIPPSRPPRLAYLDTLCPTVLDGTRIVLNLSGRGDKDVNTVMAALAEKKL
jgi:tryptophan synthase beta chain